jgi:wobble nucleotide-excising tRNase
VLRRFESIKDCGIFEDYRWNSTVPDFERINLIYGTNGSGKTSLSRALDDLTVDGVGVGRVSIRMSDADKTNDRVSSSAHDAEFDRIFVFSDGYVRRSHDFAGDTEVEAVLTLGERTVEDEKRVVELNGLIQTAEQDLADATKADRAATKALEDEYTAIARGVVNALSRAGGSYASNSNYSKAQAKSKFAGSHSDWALLSEADKEAALSTVNSDERSPVPSKAYSYEVREKLAEEASDALALSPISVVLDTLVSHEPAASWVERGRHLHEGVEQCIFCGGPLSGVRKQQIEQHFSDEVEAAQRVVDGLIQELKAAQSTVGQLLGDGAVAGLLFEDLRAGFQTAHDTARTEATQVTNWLAGLLGALETKRANVVASAEYDVGVPPAIDGTALTDAIQQHNDRVARHATLVQEAAKKIELHLLKETETKVATLVEAAARAAKAKAEVETSLAKHREEVAALENVEGDPLPSAEVMARELTRILGRNELSFELLPDGKHYRVTRHGRPARDLSTGERTAITLIHFLESVKRAHTGQMKPIVVIDDPVSSLDGSSAIGISTYIWSEVVSKNHIEQVFLLTHNFELFRQWDIQIDGLPGGQQRRGPSNNRGFTSNCYELIAPHRDHDGTPKRVPAFILWPPSEETRVKVRSAYHHAFITAARAHIALADDSTMEKKLDAQLLYPNLLRRMLETFLAFKSPTTVGNFTTAMRDHGAALETAGYKGDADALRLQLTRFTHANSHAESPETDITVSPDEVGAIIAAVFTFMSVLDPVHFDGLCNVVGVDQSDLLMAAPVVVDHTVS